MTRSTLRRTAGSVLVLVGTSAACASTTVTRHQSLSSAGAADATGFGLGHTSSETSGFGHSESLSDVRVDHAADRGDGTRDRFWRVSPGAAQDALAIFSQHLELCTGGEPSARRCTAAKLIDKEGKAIEPGGMPVLVEAGMLGGSSRATKSSGATMYGTVTWESASGSVRDPQARRSTPAFGMWTLASPVTAMPGIFSTGSVGGAPMFCHAPDAAAPKCHEPTDGAPIARVLAVDVIRQSDKLVHVLWYQSRTLATYDTVSIPANTIVRCEAEDAGGKPTCQSTEVTR